MVEVAKELSEEGRPRHGRADVRAHRVEIASSSPPSTLRAGDLHHLYLHRLEEVARTAIA
jgi:hypothetical protein